MACLVLSDPLCKCLELEVEHRDTKEDWDPEDADKRGRHVMHGLQKVYLEEFDSEEAEENDAEAVPLS